MRTSSIPGCPTQRFIRVSSSSILGRVSRRVPAGRAEHPRSGQPPTKTQRRRKTLVKRVLYLAVAALVAMLILVPTAMAQGEQAQEWVQNAQNSVDQARQYMETPEGQAALEDARAQLEDARANLQERGEQARENAQQALLQAQARVDEARQYMQSPDGQAALDAARASAQEALQDLQGAVQEKKQEVTSKMERTALVKSGGPGVDSLGALAAPAAALLVGGAVLGYAVLRRR